MLNINADDISKGLVVIQCALKEYQFAFYRFKTISEIEAIELKRLLENTYSDYCVKLKKDSGEFVFFINRSSV